MLKALQQSVQDQVRAVFHYALEPQGEQPSYLFVGASDVGAPDVGTTDVGTTDVGNTNLNNHGVQPDRAEAEQQPTPDEAGVDAADNNPGVDAVDAPFSAPQHASTVHSGAQVLFEPLAESHQIYRRRAQEMILPLYPIKPLVAAPTTASRQVDLAQVNSWKLTAATASPDGPAPAVTHRGTQSDHGQMHRLLLEELGPPSLLVDEQYQVLHLSESVGRFLHVPGGTLTSDVRRLVPSELQPGLQWALAAAFADGHTVYTEPVPVQFDDMLQLVTLAVQPTRQGQHALILFFAGEATTLPTLPSPTVIDQAAPTDGEMLYALALRRLRQRLFALDLGDTTTVVELRDSNAELLSTNEEYRLLLNDVEVHKEELSSANEELRCQ
ncbi:MAG: hypothetical protein R2932_22685 [Caldilineaceae bacterium]